MLYGKALERLIKREFPVKFFEEQPRQARCARDSNQSNNDTDNDP